jgi:hypothetical protein
MSAQIQAEPDVLTQAWSGILAAHWPDLFARLGARASDYLDAARRKAALHQLVLDAAVARYVNLCCVLGPNFEDKPDNEWALAVLVDERLDEWVKLHQLVVRCAGVLGRRAEDGRQQAAQFLRADAALLDWHDARHKEADADAAPLPRLACDLEAVDIRVLDNEWRQEYRQLDGVWQLAGAVPALASVRIGPGRPAPSQITVLTHAPKLGGMARLQVRLLSHARCDQDRHPLVSYAGAHGLSQWRGHQAQAVSWQVPALAPMPAAPGMGVALLEEPVPDTALLRGTTCGLRDDGVPTGPLQTYVWAYPADQYLFALQREAGEEQVWPGPANAQAPSAFAMGATRCRLERDGAPLASAGWAQGLQERMHEALGKGLDDLFSAWQRSAQNASMRCATALMTGKATLTWGWRESEQGLAGAPFMRVAGELDLLHKIDLELAGDIEVGVTRSRVRLLVKGDAPMQHVLAREAALPSLFDLLLGLTARWQMKFQVEFDPLAVDDAAMWCEAGPCTGSLVGEVGLRPRLSGGGGWQWYARMHSEPVSLPICVHDPVLGQTRKTLFLLPSVNLLDWSLG